MYEKFNFIVTYAYHLVFNEDSTPLWIFSRYEYPCVVHRPK